jgi:glutamyl-tRNA reductase
MNILLIGFNYHQTPVDIREQLFVDDKQATALLAELTHQLNIVREVVILSTCNRVELYCVTDNVLRAEEQVLKYLSQWFDISVELLQEHRFIRQDRDAINYLMTIASGLDSMILGEPQILGQVSRAIESAQKVSASGKILNRVFTDAIHTGKRARTETPISEHSTSVSHVAALKVAESLVDVDNPRVVIVGAGEMAKICVRALIHHNITNICIMNRTYQRSQALANDWGVTTSKWHKLWDELHTADAVITATGAHHTILHRPDIENVMQVRHQRELLMVDVAVPRDIESSVDELQSVTVFDIDDLQQVIDGNLAQRQTCIPQVHSIIESELEKCTAWLAGLKVVPVIRGLREKVTLVVEDELATVLNRLDHLSDEDHDAIEKFAHRIVNKVLHEPTTNLREHAIQEDSENYSRVVRDLFALDNIKTAR